MNRGSYVMLTRHEYLFKQCEVGWAYLPTYHKKRGKTVLFSCKFLAKILPVFILPDKIHEESLAKSPAFMAQYPAIEPLTNKNGQLRLFGARQCLSAKIGL